MYYIMLSPKKLGRAKIGYSNKPQRRAKQVDATVVASFVLPFDSWSRSCEATLHAWFKIYSSSERKKDGSTEWFWCLNIVCPLIAYYFNIPYWYILLLPLPFDILLFSTTVCAITWLIPLVIFYATALICN